MRRRTWKDELATLLIATGAQLLILRAADWARANLGEALSWLVERGDIDLEDARRVGRQILTDNATALYRLSG